MIGPVLFILFGLVLLWIFFTYNSLVTSRVRVDDAWSQIDVQLKRRHDLIPNLVEAVKGYMNFEKETLERVIKARQQAIQANSVKNKSEAENFLTQTLRSLFAVVERYPDLKANQNVLKLQEELTSTENRISFSRQYYNDEVANYNTSIQLVPASIVAKICSFTKRDFFVIADEAEKKAPEVKF